MSAGKPTTLEMTIDPNRTHFEDATGIYVRAMTPDKTIRNADIAELDTESLDAWLRSRDSIEWPISVVKLIMGHRQDQGGQE